MRPVAVVFHDPLGRQVYGDCPELAWPGLDADTFLSLGVSYVYPDGTERAIQQDEVYLRLVPNRAPSVGGSPACPFLQSLLGLPYWPEDYSARMLASTAENESRSKHWGTLGKREEVELEYVGSAGPFESEWGVSWKHEFLRGVDKIVWWTSGESDIIPGERRTVRATPKRHEWDRGEAVTLVSRVSPVKGGLPLTKGRSDGTESA